MRVSVLFFSVLLVTGFQAVYAKGPGLQETIDFIVRKFEICGKWTRERSDYGYGTQWYYTDTTISRIVKDPRVAKIDVMVQVYVHNTGGYLLNDKYIFVAKWKNFAPDNIVVKGTDVTLNCHRDRNCISYEKFKYKIKKKYRFFRKPIDKSKYLLVSKGETSSLWFTVCDHDTAVRVKRAMQHLIKLNGGKKSLF